MTWTEDVDEMLRQHCDRMVEHYGHMSTAVEEACRLREGFRDQYVRTRPPDCAVKSESP